MQHVFLSQDYQETEITTEIIGLKCDKFVCIGLF